MNLFLGYSQQTVLLDTVCTHPVVHCTSMMPPDHTEGKKSDTSTKPLLGSAFGFDSVLTELGGRLSWMWLKWSGLQFGFIQATAAFVLFIMVPI